MNAVASRAQIFAACLALAASTAAAQDPYVRIRVPTEWRDNQALAIAPGRPVTISGVAWHPEGVKQVLVDGVAATLAADPPIVNFERSFTPVAQSRFTAIVIVSEKGNRFETRFSFATTQPRGPVANPAGVSRQEAAPAGNSTANNTVAAVSPWHGFRVRSWWWGGALVAAALVDASSSHTGQGECYVYDSFTGECLGYTSYNVISPATYVGQAAALGWLTDAVITAVRKSKWKKEHGVASSAPPGEPHIVIVPARGGGLFIGVGQPRF